MTLMISEKAVRQAVYVQLNVAPVTTLLGNGSASLVDEEAQANTKYPICVFWKPSGVSVNAFGEEAFRDQLWAVKGICEGASASIAEDIDKAAYDAMQFGTLNIAGAEPTTAIRESDISYSETVDGQTYKHRGGYYRLKVTV